MNKNTGRPPGLFVTGTNTEVGKTYVTAMLARYLVARSLRVGVYKPVASGCIERDGIRYSEDAELLWSAAGMPLSLADVTPQLFAAAVAPNVAARLEGQRVDEVLLRSGVNVWSDYDITLVEGVGGLMSPISDSDLVIDVASDLGFPVVIVVANELGCINQTLQTIEVARSRGLQLAGMVLNEATQAQDASCKSNHAEIARWTDVPILAKVGWLDSAFDTEKLFPWLPN